LLAKPSCDQDLNVGRFESVLGKGIQDDPFHVFFSERNLNGDGVGRLEEPLNVGIQLKNSARPGETGVIHSITVKQAMIED